MFKKKSSTPEGRRRPVDSSEQGRAVFSYYASRSARPGSARRQNQPELVTAASHQRRNTRLKWFRRSPLMIGLALLAVLVVLNLPVSDTPKIVSAKDSAGGIFLRPSTDYSQTAQRLLGSSIWRSFKPTLNTRQLEDEMRREFPELASVTVALPVVGTQPVIYLEPSAPALILAPSPSELYVVDANGRALIDATAVRNLEKLKLPVVRDDSQLPVELGKVVLPSTHVAYITEVVGQLQAKKLELEGLTLPAGTQQLDVKVKGFPYFVKFNLQGDARAEVGAYLAVKQHLKREGKTPNSYIDVRVPDRAYYR